MTVIDISCKQLQGLSHGSTVQLLFVAKSCAESAHILRRSFEGAVQCF